MGQFPIGTVVYLKTGSPPMVACGPLRSDAATIVEWFDKSGILHRETFDDVNIFQETPELEYYRAARLNNVYADHALLGDLEGGPT